MNNSISLPEDFIPNITNEELTSALSDPEWEDSVAEAALFAATHCISTHRDPDTILSQVINYNVTKKVQELYLTKAKPLPTSIVWDISINSTQAYELLEYIVLQFCLCKNNTTNKTPAHKITLQIDNELIEIRLKNWCLQLEELYTKVYEKPVAVKYTALKTPHKYKINLK